MINEQTMTLATHSTIEPVALKADGPDRLLIVWSDGHRDVFTWGFLREHCPCALCRTEAEKPKPLLMILKPQEAQESRPVSIEPVGRYAYHITWNDGHTSGIYSFEHLLALAQKLSIQEGV